MFQTKNNQAYQLQYTENILGTVEDICNLSLQGAIAKMGMFPIKVVRQLFLSGLCDAEGNRVRGELAEEIYEEVKTSYGFVAVVEEEVRAMQRDCPFLFPAGNAGAQKSSSAPGCNTPPAQNNKKNEK